MLLPLALPLLTAGVAGFLAWDRHRMCVAIIEGELRRLHARDVSIAFDWMDFDRDTFTYDVEYRDAKGRRHANRCKVTAMPGPDDGIVFWQYPLEPADPARRPPRPGGRAG